MTANQELYTLPPVAGFTRIDDTTGILYSGTSVKRLSGEAVDHVEDIIAVIEAEQQVTLREISDRIGIKEDTTSAVLDIIADHLEIRAAEQDPAGILHFSTSTPDLPEPTIQSVRLVTLTSHPESDDSFLKNMLPKQIEHVSLSSPAELQADWGRDDFLLTYSIGEQPSFHKEINAFVHSCGLKWLPSRIVKNEIRIGPMVIPDETACYNCYYKRHIASSFNSKHMDLIYESREESKTSVRPNSFGISAMHSMAFSELICYLNGRKIPAVIDGLVKIQLPDVRSDTSNVLRLPNCQICAMN